MWPTGSSTSTPSRCFWPKPLCLPAPRSLGGFVRHPGSEVLFFQEPPKIRGAVASSPILVGLSTHGHKPMPIRLTDDIWSWSPRGGNRRGALAAGAGDVGRKFGGLVLGHGQRQADQRSVPWPIHEGMADERVLDVGVGWMWFGCGWV